eukprot:6191867-Pleurochrysis_carterae.AAC.2
MRTSLNPPSHTRSAAGCGRDAHEQSCRNATIRLFKSKLSPNRQPRPALSVCAPRPAGHCERDLYGAHFRVRVASSLPLDFSSPTRASDADPCRVHRSPASRATRRASLQPPTCLQQAQPNETLVN